MPYFSVFKTKLKYIKDSAWVFADAVIIIYTITKQGELFSHETVTDIITPTAFV